MRAVSANDIETSIATALQSISHTHPADFVQALKAAHATETHAPARHALLQLLVNSKLSAQARRPVCQDTGVAHVYVRMGMDVRVQHDGAGPTPSLQTVANRAVARAYGCASNPLRASMVRDPLGARRNTRDNTPAIVQVELVEGECLDLTVVAKGGGGDVKTRYAMLNPSDSVADWVVSQLPGMGAGWCPPGVLGLGIGGTPEQAMALAKRALFTPIDMPALLQRGAHTPEERLRADVYQRVNALGIGAQGLGGDTTVLDIKVATAPSHAALLPVALVPNCAATRFVSFSMPADGPAPIPPSEPATWDGIPDALPAQASRRIDLDTLTPAEVATWTAGETLLLSGKLLTGRDAAHKRMADLLDSGQPLPVPLRGRALYYVGPVDPVAGEAVGPAGPTTATRMDKFMPQLLAQTGLLITIGKAERGKVAVDAIKRHGAAYLSAVGGAAYLVSRTIQSSRVVAFDDLGMEAIYEFEVCDMPVTVAVDSLGRTTHAFIRVNAEH
ncbi:fumarate hydratase [Achromobacter seleniivolatilans]|uniref:Fumarate hydratase class I n=1 Tax=Achromobacter seleniivolatilans TaxID=3047478 RepID=A0ABY9M558_9BURK|nr:fumarate hydratase [Achromobacter sp. R39]WMD22148.1 fumarate hydratase [Achromobacter sp. R39]